MFPKSLWRLICQSFTLPKLGTMINEYGSIFFSRALEFIYVFLETVVQGEEDLVKCANKAYDASLRKYHGWIVRGVFSVSGIFIYNLATMSIVNISGLRILLTLFSNAELKMCLCLKLVSHLLTSMAPNWETIYLSYHASWSLFSHIGTRKWLVILSSE